jgi:hypothetical protein
MFKAKLDVPLSATGIIIGAALGVTASPKPAEAFCWEINVCSGGCNPMTCWAGAVGHPGCQSCTNNDCKMVFGPCIDC